MSEKEIDDYRRKMGDIKVRGIRCPKPVMNWYQAGLHPSLLSVIEKKKFLYPTPIQAQSLPVIMSG